LEVADVGVLANNFLFPPSANSPISISICVSALKSGRSAEVKFAGGAIKNVGKSQSSPTFSFPLCGIADVGVLANVTSLKIMHHIAFGKCSNLSFSGRQCTEI
jgi:hypothetical protein